jgi:hypothetical protein
MTPYLRVLATAQRIRHRQWTKLSAYSFELAAAHVDVWFLRQKLLTFLYETIDALEAPDSATGLVVKKALVIHVEQDICHWLYSYREKVWQLLNVAFEIGLDERSARLRSEVHRWLGAHGERQLLQELESFDRKEVIRSIIDRRHSLTHRLSPIELRTLSREQILGEYLIWDVEADELLGRDASQVAAGTFEVDEYQQRLVGQLEEIEAAVRDFERRLCSELVLSFSREPWSAARPGPG